MKYLRSLLPFAFAASGFVASPHAPRTPLKGGKAMKLKSGIRVPWVLRELGKTAEGGWCNVPIDYADLFPRSSNSPRARFVDLRMRDPRRHIRDPRRRERTTDRTA